MPTLPVTLTTVQLEKIDLLVKMGRYKNRSQAIKALLELGIHHVSIRFDWEDVDENNASCKVLMEMLQMPKSLIRIKSDKSAHELISEDRTR